MIAYPWIRGLLSLVLVAGGLSFACGSEPPPAEWSAEQLRALVADAQRLVRGIYVEYRSQRGAYKEPEYPPGSYLQRIVAAKAPCYLYHVNAHGHERLDWQDDPLQQRCRVTAQHWYVANPVQRTYWEGTLRPEDPLPGTMPGEFFFLATGLWPLVQRPPPRVEGQPYVLREVAACADYQVVRPRQELVDGHWCHVLERPAVDCLWIDARRGCTLLARETRSPTSKILMQRIELSGHREVVPDVWLPMSIRNIQYDHQARTDEGRRRKVKDAVLEVLEIKVNLVEDSLFDYQPPPGALKLRGGLQPPVQTHPGGLDHLDHLVHWMRANTSAKSSPRSAWALYFAGLPALLVILAADAWRRWRNLLARHRCPERDSFQTQNENILGAASKSL